MANILITGGCGFIGTNLVKELMRDHNLTIIDNFNSEYDSNIKENNWKFLQSAHNKNPINHSLKLVRDDILNINNSALTIQNTSFDYLIHLAAKVEVRNSSNEFYDYYKENVEGTKNILDFCVQKKIHKIINLSSSAVYGDQLIYPVTEESIPKPISFYGKSKLRAEKICDQYVEKNNISIISFRPVVIYGPFLRPNMAISSFFETQLRKEPFIIYGNGEYRREFVYISDLINAIKLALNYETEKNHEIFNIGNEYPISINDLIKLCSNILEINPEIKYCRSHEEDIEISNLDSRKAYNLLSWKPEIGFLEGLYKYWKCLNKVKR